jgi:Fur family transcriptional regulator, peroxide stress response regulator
VVSIKDIQELLQSHNIKPSITKVKIMEYLIRHATHPTVDEIYSNLLSELPTLSRTTVYNTLGLFTRARLVRVFTLGDNENRYDANAGNHGHFKCNRCGRVYDFGFDPDLLPARGLDGFRISEKNVYYRGTCPGCLCENAKNDHEQG